MTIYAEYLFIENFLAGYGIIRLTGMLCGRKPSWMRVAAGAVLCGGFAFMLMLNLSRLAALGIEVIFALLLMVFVFKPREKIAAARLTVVFFVVSFMLGGAAVAFIYALGIKGVVSNGVLYIGEHGYLKVFAGGAAGIFTMKTVVDYIRKKAPKGDEYMKVTVELMGIQFTCTGKVDTGNSLKEPVSGKPVSLIRRAYVSEMWKALLESSRADSRMRAVPFRSLGCESGIITAVRCDKLTVHRDDAFGSGPLYLKNVYLGLYDGEFSGGDEEHYDILLQPDMINGGSD